MNWHGLNEWQQWTLAIGGSLVAAFLIWLARRIFFRNRIEAPPKQQNFQQTASPTITQIVHVHPPAAVPPKTSFQAPRERNEVSSEEAERRLAQLEKELNRLIENMTLIHSSQLHECCEQILRVIEDIKGFFTNFPELRHSNIAILKPFYSKDFPTNFKAGARVYWSEEPQVLEEANGITIVSDPCSQLVNSLVRSLLELRVRTTRTMKDYEDSLR